MGWWRRTLAGTLYHAGVFHLVRYGARRSLRILRYRRVLPNDALTAAPEPESAITPDGLAAHLRFLRRAYTCLPLSEALTRLAERSHVRRPLLSVTFDDGYEDQYLYAAPVLRAVGVRATFFVTSSLVGSHAAPWYDQLARALVYLRGLSPEADEKNNPVERLLDRVHPDGRARSPADLVASARLLDADTRTAAVDAISASAIERGWRPSDQDRIMSARQLRDLVAEGHEIGANGRTHAHLPLLSAGDCAAELLGARQDLELVLGVSVTALAYPDGLCNAAIVQAARDAGYRCAVTTCPGGNGAAADPLRLRRHDVKVPRYHRPAGAFAPALLAMDLVSRGDTLPGRVSRAVL